MNGASPVLLDAANFTPPARTPWGGRRIVERLKRGLGITTEAVVGESWEISVEPSFPSRVAGRHEYLGEVIAADPVAWLGRHDAARYGQLPLLVKLLDADEPLSVQVHPSDGDRALGPGESGKPEAWVVLHREPGAGLYLGFREGVERSDVRACIERGGDLSTLLQFAPVEVGDAFVIDAGTPHAIGPGLTLLEPQYVSPGRRGVTYRYWDWNRRYADDGQPDERGEPRPLHLERSLEVTDWSRPRGAAFVAECRSEPRAFRAGTLHGERLIAWRWFEVFRLRGTGRCELRSGDRLAALTCVGGRAELHFSGGRLSLVCGQSAVVPACVESVDVDARDLDLFVTHTARY